MPSDEEWSDYDNGQEDTEMSPEEMDKICSDLDLDPIWVDDMVERYSVKDVKALYKVPKEERDSEDFKDDVKLTGVREYIRYTRENKKTAAKNAEKARNADFTHVRVPGSLDADEASGSTQDPNTDVTPMQEYDQDNAVNRGNVFFLPALSNETTSKFTSKNSGLTVISFGVKEHDCTMYLLAPTALVENFRWRLDHDEPEKVIGYYSEFTTTDVEDTNYDKDIEGLKKWAPGGTRFMKQRVDMNHGLPKLWYTTWQTLQAAFTDAGLSEYFDGASGTGEEAYSRVSAFLGKFTKWWNASQDSYRADLAKPKYVAPLSEEIKVQLYLEGGVMLSNGEFVDDDDWGFNPYKSSCTLM